MDNEQLTMRKNIEKADFFGFYPLERGGFKP
jgi:hypothetical protein